MAFSVTSNFAGDVIDQIFQLLITQNETVDGGHIHIENNIFKQRSIPRMNSDNLIQDRAPTPTSAGTLTYTERTLAPQDIMVYVEFNPNDFRDVWEPFQPTGDFVFSGLPTNVQTAIVDLVLSGIGGVNPYMGEAIWQGDTAGSAPFDKFDGLVKLAQNDADTIKQDNPAGAGMPYTASDIVAALELAYANAPVSVRKSPNFKIFCSDLSKELYWNALQAASASDANPYWDVAQGGPLTYKGKPIVSLVGFPDDVLISTHAAPGRESNLYLGLAGPGANNESVLNIDRLQNNSELWFVKVLWGAGTQIKWGQELVIVD